MHFLELKVPPPLVAVLLAVMMWIVPNIGNVELPFAMRVVLAVALVLIGQCISVSGMIQFRRARTTINPIKASTASSLVCTGIYRHTRNPMYVGQLLTLLGWAVYLANPLALVFLVAYVLYINQFQIKPEERVHTSLFGKEYVAYTGRVRRWL